MNKRYDELFGEIVDILRRDWAGANLAGDRLDPRYYNQAIGQAWHDGHLDELLFLRYISQMLACTGDRHLRLTLRPTDTYAPHQPGFFARRYSEALYVTAVTDDTRLCPGDRIDKINGGTPAEHRRTIQKNFFYADEPEREDWRGLLKMADYIDVTHPDGTTERLELKGFPVSSASEMTDNDGRAVAEASAAPSVLDEVGVGRFVSAGSPEESSAEADDTTALLRPYKGGYILDLRNRPDIGEDAILALLPHFCRRDTPLSAMIDTELYVNYTRRNCLIKAAGLQGLDGAEEYIAELAAKAGRGYLPEDIGDETTISGEAAGPVVVLIDTWTRGGAETLALAAKRAGAYLIGRPALGTIDLCGDVSYELDERYVLTWPTAITKAARDGNGVFGRGVAPNLYIPWTPAECASDVLMDAAESYLAKE